MSVSGSAQRPDLATTRNADWDAYEHALDRAHALIDPAADRSPTREAAMVRATMQLGRLDALLQALGNPHRQPPLIHIAGTSGKGSTAAAIAGALTAGGFRTGLHTSPYLQAATEKLQIDGSLISGTALAELVDIVLTAAAGLPDFDEIPTSYGELWMALALLWFGREAVDVAVIETGAGGRFDLSNLITPVISVITTIGFDHMETLGPTIAEIAWHKAGIIKPGVPVVTGVRDPEALEVIVLQANETGSRLVFPDSRDQPGSLAIDSSVLPEFQTTNLALASATLRELNTLGFAVSAQSITDGIASIPLPGRFEVVQSAPIVVLDGAHNIQKVASLATSIRALRPMAPGTTTIVFGALESKHPGEMLAALSPVADRLVLTAPLVVGKTGADPAKLGRTVAAMGFSGEIESFDDADAALDAALATARPEDLIVVTGSLYLVGNVRERWFSTRQIVEQLTPWPRPAMS